MGMQNRDQYEIVVGLEIHAQLATESKIYAADANLYGNEPNTNVSVITLAHPGTMPKLNKKVMEYAIKMGLACQSNITRFNIFCRKNYFYPDSPKGFQLTQDKTPICVGGKIDINTPTRGEIGIRLNRIHIEEDAGKSIHQPNEKDTLIDLNRAGVPLIEIVTEPDIRSSEEAAAVVTEVRKIVRFLGICDGNMEEGSLRCDANVSIMPRGSDRFGNKVELKNMNSIRNVKNAIDHEVDRQIQLVESGEKIISETRTFNPDTGESQGMRTKEELNDYRYFPEPDLSPVEVKEEWLEQIRKDMPVLPAELKVKYMEEYQLPEYDASFLSETRTISDFFNELCQLTTNYKAASNWMMGPVKSWLNERGADMTTFPLTASRMAELISLIDEGKVNFTIASQQLFKAMVAEPETSAEKLAEKLNLTVQKDSSFLEEAVDEILKSNPDKVKAYHNGKKNLIGMFMGELMKETKGKADPKTAKETILKKLEQHK